MRTYWNRNIMGLSLENRLSSFYFTSEIAISCRVFKFVSLMMLRKREKEDTIMILYTITFVLIIGSLIATVLQTVLRGFAGNFKLYYLMRVISTLTIFLATFIGVLFVLCQIIFVFERSDAEMPVAVYYVSNLVYGIIRDQHVTDPKHIVFMVLFLVFAYVFHLLASHSENPYYKNEEIKKRFYNGAKEFAKEYITNENGSFDAETYCPICGTHMLDVDQKEFRCSH